MTIVMPVVWAVLAVTVAVIGLAAWVVSFVCRAVRDPNYGVK